MHTYGKEIADMKMKDIRTIIEDESLDNTAKIKKILDLHHEETDTIREELDTAKGDLKKAQDDLKAANTDKEKVESDFANYKTEQGKKETRAKKEAAYKALLKDAGVAEKYISLILKGTDLDGHELGDDGKFKEASKLTESIKAEHADFISKKQSSGAVVDNPPEGGKKGKMSREDILKMADPVARQQAIADNPEAFE